uniref:Thioredoxin domain-containing protein n=1 Tax=Chenopodium quinoa TaxID=63459 RepID=A0A803LBD4_CHEQI
MTSILSNLCCGCICGSYDDDDDSFHANGNVQHILTLDAWEETLNLKGKIIIACFKASWCGPCRVIAPFYGDLSRKYASSLFVSIDVDDVPDLSDAFNIQATPVFFFFMDRQELDVMVGSNKADLQKKVASVIELYGQEF